MKADVFNAMIHFMYTDQISRDRSSDLSLLSVERVQDLFVAADRYAPEKLKAVCELLLTEKLSADTVAQTLSLADRHDSAWLKEVF